MRRRDSFKLIPLVVAGAGVTGRMASALDSCPKCPAAGDDGPLTLMYSRKVTDMLRRVRATQSENILEAGYQIARTYKRGNKVWSCWDLGHTNAADLFPGRQGQPEILAAGYDQDKVRDGDMVLANFPWPPGYINDLRNHDLYIVGGPCPWGGDCKGYENIVPDIRDMKIRPVSDIWIETWTNHIGAQVPIPGSDAPLGPESGPLNTTILWMMVADACRFLAIDGLSSPVKGSGDTLKDDAARVSLDAPLMGTFFDEVLHQIKDVGTQLGAMREVVSMAVDSLLGGGNVYFYSRYFDSLAGEAVGRRGGFMFAKGYADGHTIKGTDKDTVVMGVYEPDDPEDLKNLDTFRKLGMKVASIGPTTRDYRHPEGRAVYKETDVHLGGIGDTNGMFAIPGFERKVCPTSGIINTTMLWETSVELALEIGRRTGGNAPAIYFNGALTWSATHNARMMALMQRRGY